jgi:hypothetical protein
MQTETDVKKGEEPPVQFANPNFTARTNDTGTPRRQPRAPAAAFQAAPWDLF